MGDMSEMFAAVKKESMQRRARNRSGSAKMLTEAGHTFESKNRGAHLVVEAPDGRTVDFWPGTGLWIDRKTQERKRGVRSLLRHLYGLQGLKKR